MRCERCGRQNPSENWDCDYCGAPLETLAYEEDGDSRPLDAWSLPIPRARRRAAASRAPSGFARWGASLAPTIALALALAVVGVGGVQAATLLKHAIRPEPAGLATQLCAELKARSYDQVVSQIDPTPDPTQKASAVLDPTALAGQLRSLDGSAGTITKCTFQQLSYVDSSSHGAVANFTMTLQREKQGNAQTVLLILVQKSDGTWKIARSTNLAAGA